MPPTLEKLKGHIAFGVSVRPCVRASVTKFIKIQFMDSSSKMIGTYFYSLGYPSLWSYASFKWS